MSRVQLALNVTDLDAAIGFYSAMFETSPAKVREGYANFVVESPPLKLVLIENPSANERLNHLGVEVEDPSEVTEATERLVRHGLDTEVEEQVDCCYAVQTKVWVRDPDDAPWEVYVVLGEGRQRDRTDVPVDATALLAGDHQ